MKIKFFNKPETSFKIAIISFLLFFTSAFWDPTKNGWFMLLFAIILLLNMLNIIFIYKKNIK